jgi:hypothetical protein
MLSHHAWDRSMQRLDRIIEGCLSSHRQSLGAPQQRIANA